MSARHTRLWERTDEEGRNLGVAKKRAGQEGDAPSGVQNMRGSGGEGQSKHSYHLKGNVEGALDHHEG